MSCLVEGSVCSLAYKGLYTVNTAPNCLHIQRKSFFQANLVERVNSWASYQQLQLEGTRDCQSYKQYKCQHVISHRRSPVLQHHLQCRDPSKGRDLSVSLLVSFSHRVLDVATALVWHKRPKPQLQIATDACHVGNRFATLEIAAFSEQG